MSKQLGRLPTIPEYFREFINQSVDLDSQPKQCCPFHTEDTPSFSYSREKGVWRCFGGCHSGGDVIELHRKNYRLKTRADAEKSLCNLYCITMQQVGCAVVDKEKIRESVIEENAVKLKALLLANSPKQWIELDYVMSKYPLELVELQGLISSWEEGK